MSKKDKSTYPKEETTTPAQKTSEEISLLFQDSRKDKKNRKPTRRGEKRGQSKPGSRH